MSAPLAAKAPARQARRNGGPVKRAPGVAARLAASAALHAVLAERRAVESVLDDPAGPFEALEPRERALARAILGTALRRNGQITDALARFLEKPLPRKSGRLAAILAVAAAQILFMDVADHAAVSIAVEIAGDDHDARHFKGLANAVLRRLTEARESILAAQDAPSLNTPAWLLKSWTKAYGAATARAIATAHLQEPALDLTVRGDAEDWALRLGGTLLPTGSVRLATRPAVESLAGFEEGAWWVQDAAAALPARLFGDVAGRRLADLCAAPGGKTLQLAAAGANVTAIDISATRLERLAANLVRTGLSADLVTADLLSYQPDRLFDAVLLDAPCSATGTIRRHPDVALLKRKEDIAALVRLQRALLARAAMLLAPGGTLVYSTCSLESEEGEEQAAFAAANLPLQQQAILPDEFPGLAAICRDGVLRSLPSDWPAEDARLGGLDGFFAARFVRI